MTGAATERLLAALQRNGAQVKTAPGERGYLATCPVPGHEDRHPSLSIEEGRGQVIYICRSGCDQHAVTDAIYSLGLTANDLYDDKRGVQYEYRDKPAGRVVRTVQRYNRDGAKSFAQSGPQARAARGAALYRPDDFDVEAAVAGGAEVWIPEGEKDADTLYRYGVAAVSSAGGAAGWGKFDYAPIAKASKVTIVADTDDPGMDRAYGLYRHLRAGYDANVRIVLPMTGKDASDHLLAGNTIAEFHEIPGDPEFEEAVSGQRRVWAVTREAKKRDGASFAAASIVAFDPKTLRDIQAIEEEERNWVIEDLLERRERFLLTGHEGAGKSHWIRQCLITSAAGLHPFERNRKVEPMRSLAIDAENSELQWQRTTKYITYLAERLGQCDPRDNVIVQAGYRLDLTQQTHIDLVKQWIDTYKPDIVFLGPLYKMMPKEVTNDDDAAPLLAALDSFRETGVALLMEAHAGKRKGEGGERDLAPRGSSALMGWPEFGYGLRPLINDRSMASMVAWRGDRDKRPWPTMLRRGGDGEYPWMPSTVGAA